MTPLPFLFIFVFLCTRSFFEKSFKVKEVCTCYNCLNYGKVWTNFIRAFWNILKQSFKNCNKNGEYPSYRRRYSLALFSSFICTCATRKKIEFASKSTFGIANNKVKKLVTYQHPQQLFVRSCNSFCDVITRGR